jgi:CheY-like chemotaxis protein
VNRGTVLVVDDEADVRESLAEALRDEGYGVEVAANGREAMALVGTLARPCLVILDLIMPVMSGQAVYAAMQADAALADIPILVCTSDASRAPAGALLMKKPFKLSRLLTTVEGLLRTS